MGFSSAVALSLCAIASLSHGYSLRNVELPTPRVVIVPANSNDSKDEIVLQKPPNSKLLVGTGEEIDLNSRITLECDASYPVQFIYSGDGMPEYTTNTSQSDNKREEGDQFQTTKPKIWFEAQLYLGSGRPLGYYDSGRYTCRSLQDATKAVHYYLFVSDGKLFVRPDGETIYFRRSDPSVRIPCSVTNPNAVVSLQKSVNGLVQCPLNDSISFDPVSGFQVKNSNRFDPAGTYVCTAGHKGNYQAMQYIVQADDSSANQDRQECRRDVDCPNNEACLSNGNCGSPCANSCGQNTSCRTVNHLAQCKCNPGHVGDPYNSCYPSSSSSSPGPGAPENIQNSDPCHPYPCGQNTVCENHNGVAKCSCATNFQGDPYYRCYRRQSDPCNPNPCGGNSVCQNRNNYASCSCRQGFIGTPPHCRAECESDYHCGHSQVCRQYRCRNPCEGACDDIPNTQCRVINRRPVCARVQTRCPPGHYGRDCSKIYEKEEASQESSPQPDGPVVSPCAPFPCGSNAECMTKKVNNLALNETTDVALCQCPPGKTGNADVECFAVDEIIITHEELRADLPEFDDEETENPVEQESTSPIPPSTTTTSNTESENELVSTKAPKKCGNNAISIVSEGKWHCGCPVGFTGIPTIECHTLNEVQQLDDNGEEQEENVAEPEYCTGTNASSTLSCTGENTVCVVINGTQSCRCLRDFKGDPELGCELECNSDSDCPSQYTCYSDSKRCVDPCSPSLQMFFTQCGRDARCRVEDHQPVCYCPPDLPHGSPEVHCKEKSWMPTHLPQSPHPTCDKKEDKCGSNAECRAFHDSHYCSCKPGYYGNPNQGCELGIQCRNSTQCPSQKMCINGRCLDPCKNKALECGPHAGCTSDEHAAKCICNIGAIRMSPDGPCEPVKGALAERLALFRSFEDFKRK